MAQPWPTPQQLQRLPLRRPLSNSKWVGDLAPGSNNTKTVPGWGRLYSDKELCHRRVNLFDLSSNIDIDPLIPATTGSQLPCNLRLPKKKEYFISWQKWQLILKWELSKRWTMYSDLLEDTKGFHETWKRKRNPQMIKQLNIDLKKWKKCSFSLRKSQFRYSKLCGVCHNYMLSNCSKMTPSHLCNDFLNYLVNNTRSNIGPQNMKIIIGR